MKKIYLVIIVIIVIVLCFFVYKNYSNKQLISGCDQSATTTDCAKLAQIYPPASSSPTTELKEVVWKKYENKDLGVSFSYPTKSTEPINSGIRNGDTGKEFSASIGLPSGLTIYAIATTRDFTIPKEAPGVGTEGYVIKDGKYYVINKGVPVSRNFIPDEILKSQNRSSIALMYWRYYDKNSDYTSPAVTAMINIPNTSSKTFTGVGFILYNLDNAGSHPASAEDLAIFKKIVTSVDFTK